LDLYLLWEVIICPKGLVRQEANRGIVIVVAQHNLIEVVEVEEVETVASEAGCLV
jgi:hypothetical protein